jgi:HlyD family secretion protein
MHKLVFAAFLLLLLGACSRNNDALKGSGTIEADVIRLSSQVAGIVAEVFVSEGEPVETGRLLAKIDDGLLAIQLRQAEAGVRLAENQLGLLLKGAREEDVRQAEALQRRAEENLKTAGDDRDRMRTLFKTGSVTQKQRDDAETRLALAETEYNSTLEGVKKIKNLTRPEEIEAARIRVEQARAARDLLAKQREYTEIRAPRAGTILTKTVIGGEFTAPGSVLFTLADLEELSLVVYVPEPDLGRIVLGGRAEVFVDSHPGRAFPAETVHIAQEAEFTPRNVQTREERVKLVYAVKLTVKNPEGILKIGMPADAVLEGKE